MSPPLDTWLAQRPPEDAAARQRALEAARRELALRRPVRRWRTQAVGLFAGSALLMAVVAGVLLGLGRTSGETLATRAPLLALLGVSCAVGAWGALAPRGGGWRAGGLVLALVSAGMMVLMRGPATGVSTLPEWVCTASHVGVGLLPLGVALTVLRGAAFRPSRAMLAGLSAGTTGAFVGELACTLDWHHVLLYHLPAWALVSVATLGLSRLLRPRSFAP